MRRLAKWFLVPLLVILMSGSSFADSTPLLTHPSVPVVPIIDSSLGKPGIPLAPVLVAFSAVPNRYTDVDPATVFDLNGDLVGDLSVGSANLTGKNGAKILLVDPAALSLDLVQSAPASGYQTSVPAQLSRVYVAKLADGGYAKFMLLQITPKVTIWFSYGKSTPSKLTVDGTGGHGVLAWNPLPDAELGYNIYRYEFLDDNSYTVTLLNDLTIQGTTFTDNTAENHYYLYVVIAIKNGGAFGSSTTVAAVSIQALLRSLRISLTDGTATLDGTTSVTLDAPPVIKNGRVMVPASALTSVGVTVTYDPSAGSITLARRLESVTYTVGMAIGTADYTWNGSAYKCDVLPYLVGAVPMVPLRIVAPALGYGLTFNSTDRTATLGWFE